MLTQTHTLATAFKPFKHKRKGQTIDATNHFLHVSCHGFDPAAQSIVLGNNLQVLLHPKAWKKTEKLIYYNSSAVAMATKCKCVFGGQFELSVRDGWSLELVQFHS